MPRTRRHSSLRTSTVPVRVVSVLAVPLADEWAQRRFVACMRSREALSPAARMLVDHLVHVAGKSVR